MRVKALKVRDRRTQKAYLTLTISAGVAMRRSMENGESLISLADSALYAAKQDGRDRVRIPTGACARLRRGGAES